MSYTMNSGETFNMVLSHIDRSDPSTWTAKFAKEDILTEFGGWDPRYVRMTLRHVFFLTNDQIEEDSVIHRLMHEMAPKGRSEVNDLELAIFQAYHYG
jgi:hypothetical protein